MKTKESKGITLITLAVTIVVLLILAGISTSLIIGNTSLFDRAKNTQKIQTIAGIKEALELEKVDIQVERRTVNLENYLEQISNGKKNFDLSSKEKIDDKNAEVIINDQYKFLLKDKENGDVEIIYEGVAVSGDLTLSSYEGTYTYPNRGTFTVTNNASGGELTVSSDVPNIATASIEGNTVTVVPGTTTGKADIIVKSAANGDYAESKIVHIATVENGTIKLSATPYTGIYDGQEHEALSDISVDPSNVQLEYSINGGKYSTEMPKIKDTSEFTVTVKASKEGYKTQIITETVKVNKAEGNLTLSSTSGTYTYPTSGTFTVSGNTGTLSAVSNNTNIATVSISGNTVTVKSGTTAGKATITVTSAEASNYNAKSATYTATVNNGTITITATPYTGTYDGKSHNAFTSVTTNPSDAKLEYSTDGTTYNPTMPTITNASSFTVTVRASKAGYATKTATETVKVNKAAGALTLSATSGKLEYPNSTTFTVSGNTGTLSVSSSNTNVATATISGNTVTVKSGSTAGTATITVRSAATSNYNAKSSTYNVTVKTTINNLKIGDYVDYAYDTVSDYTLEVKYSGHWAKQTITQTTGLKWRILNIDKTIGTIDLVSENPTDMSVYFGGILGYNNGPYLMNEICKSQYSNKTLGIEARNINLLDMEKHLTPAGITARNAHSDSGGVKYGTTTTYTSNMKYPSLYARQKGAGVNVAEENASTIEQPDISKGNDPYGESNAIAVIEPTTDNTYGTGNPLTVTQTAYNMSINSENYGEAANVLRSSNAFWVAARCVGIGSFDASFNLRYAHEAMFNYEMFLMNGSNIDNGSRLRPIVSLPSSVLTGEQTNGVWNLRK